MIRKLIVSFTLAVLSLAISAPFALGQQQTAKLPKQNPFRTPTKDTNTTAGASLKAALEGGRAKAAVNANSSNKNGQLQTFTYTVTSSRDGNSYSGQIVGRNPFDQPARVHGDLHPAGSSDHTDAFGVCGRREWRRGDGARRDRVQPDREG